MESLISLPNISQVIQQAVAPVFLLTGIGSILSVLTSRLGRVVDRFRQLNEKNAGEISGFTDEILTLGHRARWIHPAITLCTISALCIGLSIAALFIGAEMHVDLSRLVALLFVAAMLALISGLLCFLREIALSTSTIEFLKRKI